MITKWYIYSKKADFKAIGEQFGIDQVTARILRNRDITGEKEIDLFLNGTLEDLYDENLLPDIDRAAAVLMDAISRRQKIRIVGDYDIDGVCSTLILQKGLKALGAEVDHRIPHRIQDGYGINRRIVEEAVEDRVDLILTCDNGIAAIDELSLAEENGITVIVTDHHNVRLDEAGEEMLPPAEAVIDVKRKDSSYPTTEICGAVTAWKLIRRLYELAERDSREWLGFLEFAAIATIGDIMTLTGENRILVKEGIRVLNGGLHPDGSGRHGTGNIGLRMLLRNLNLDEREIDTFHIGFMIGPCINAGGRLKSAGIALDLFLTEDPAEADRLSMQLITLNEERKSMTEKGVKDAAAAMEAGVCGEKVLVVFLPELHESLAGIVAGRIKDQYNRPTIVVTRGSEGLKGSGRSIESYDMFEGLCKAADYLVKFGGHRLAAGMSLREEDLEGFRDKLNADAENCLKEDDFVRKIWIDAAMPFGYISEKLVREIEKLAPFGQGFEKPVFAQNHIRVSGLKVLGKQKNVLKMRLTDANGISLDAIMFGDAVALREELAGAEEISILYYPKINEFAGRRTLQLELRDYLLS